MLTKTKMALVAALILSTASAALASDHEDTGGAVMPGSLDGVNPADHPGIFGNPTTARSYGFVQSPDGTWYVQPNSHQEPID